jgi:Flp pilus assembly pilin Flp
MEFITLLLIFEGIMVYILVVLSRTNGRQTDMLGAAEAQAGTLAWRIHNQDVVSLEVTNMQHLFRLWRNDEGQDIAEYAVMLAVILVIVVGTIRLIGSNANNVFSSVASSIQ